MSAERDALLFGRNVFMARRRRGFTQAALARRAALSTDAISKIELGERSPRLVTLLAIADALGVDPRELFKALRGIDGTA
jgi:XRE family transcriptional regulator, fatty acid utilization regulator